MIYYSMPKNITLEDWLLRVYFPWEPSDQEPENTIQKYGLIGVRVAWEPGDQKTQIYYLEALSTWNLFSMGSRRTRVMYET
jgi:hypothetical protein